MTPRERLSQAESELTASLLASLQAAADGATAHPLSSQAELAECAALLSRVWVEGDDHRAPPCDLAEATAFPGEFGRFAIRRLCGRGGFAAVFEAFDPSLQRAVALKVPRPEVLVNPGLRVRFIRDAEASALLSHPHIVPVHEIGAVGPVPFIVAEFVAGPNLAEWLREQGPTNRRLDCRQAVGLLLPVVEAVAHAHERGVLHRDLKPSNILLEPVVGPQTGISAWVPKLTDFGLAKGVAADEHETQAGALIGTTPYMSPEQAAGQASEIGVGSDIYGLGVVLFELLTGRTPAANQSPTEVRRAVCAGELPRVRALRADVPRDLAAVTEKCLSLRSDDRYPSARELAADLRAFLERRPVKARTPGVGERIVRACRRRPAVATIGAALVLVTLAGAGGIVWQWWAAERNRLLAESHARAAERSLAEAYQRLTELGLLAEEQQLWDDPNDPLQQQLFSRIAEQFVTLRHRADLTELPADLRAVAFGIEGQCLARSGQADLAAKSFADCAEAWRLVLHSEPANSRHRHALGVALYRLAGLQGQAGDTSIQIETLDRAMAELELALVADASNHVVLEDYATLLFELANARVRLGETAAAADLYRKSLERFQALADATPENPHALLRLGQVERMLGSQREKLRDGPGARALFESSLAHLEQAVVADPANFSFRLQHAETLRAYGAILAEDNNPQARVVFERGLPVADELVRINPGDQDAAGLRAALARGLAYALLREGRTPAALDALSQAVERQLDCDRIEPLSVDRLERAALIAYDAAVLAVDVDQSERAASLFAQAIELLERAGVPRRGALKHRLALGHALIADGDARRGAGALAESQQRYERAAEILEALARRDPNHPAVKERLARVRERLSGPSPVVNDQRASP